MIAFFCIFQLFHTFLRIPQTLLSQLFSSSLIEAPRNVLGVCFELWAKMLKWYKIEFISNGLFSNSFFLSMSRRLACCINPQPGGPRDFFLIFTSFSPWYASIELQGSSASFGPPRVFYFPGTRHIWWAFPYPPPGEAPDRRLATPYGYTFHNYINNDFAQLNK